MREFRDNNNNNNRIGQINCNIEEGLLDNRIK